MYEAWGRQEQTQVFSHFPHRLPEWPRVVSRSPNIHSLNPITHTTQISRSFSSRRVAAIGDL